MWWNTGCHADRNTICTIYQNVRDAHRKYRWFFFRLIEVRNKVHYILIKITQKYILCQFFQSCLCITHGSCAVTLDWTEVTMSVYKCSAFFEILCHNNKCVINGTVTMWMIFTHGITDNTCTFTIRTVIADSQFIHIIQRSSLYWFQTVTHIRKSTGNDNTHCIIDVWFLHNFRIIGTNYIFLFCFHILSHLIHQVLHRLHARK